MPPRITIEPGVLFTPGTRFGRYRIEAMIGAGGMGEVYRAYDTTLKRPLAIKVLREGSRSGPDDQLLREAQSASALNHAAICTVYEIGAEQGSAFIAMEYVDGESLAAKIALGPLDVGDVVRWGMDVADALSHAHERGVIHRDLKAANVIVSTSGRPKIVDFGLAHRLDAQMATASTVGIGTALGLSAGTPYAMAPEQVRGTTVDRRTDIWALGILLYEMVSGRQPFTGDSRAELMASILRDPPAPLRLTPAAEPIRTVIETCLAKDPANRYQHAESIKFALQNVGSRGSGPVAATLEPAEPTPLPPPPLLERTSRESAFVGREREHGLLTHAWKRATEGRRQLCLVAGEPGIGKTRLSVEFARRCADEQATVLVGRCDEEALVPYQPFVEALGWYARVCPEASLRSAIPAGGGELGAFAPEFLVRLPDLPAPAPMNAQGQRYRLFETISGLLSAMSRRIPVLLLLDDLHWADKPTLSLVRHVVRGSDPAALLMIGTYRDGEVTAGHPLGELLADLRRESSVTRVALTGLEPGEVGRLAEALSASNVPASLSRQVAESTGGNPFFVGEMFRHLNETGLAAGLPEGIRDVILRRVSRLGETCGRALTFAAVLGREFDLDVLHAFSEIPDDLLLDSIDQARQAQLVDEAAGRPGRFTFHHALIRDALYDGLAATRRVRMHRRAAEVIERLTAGAVEPPLADLAYHFAQAASSGVAEKAVMYAERAGDRMADALAQEEACRFYDLALQALDHMPTGTGSERQRVTLHRRRARAFSNLGQWANQRAALEEALRHLQPDQTEERCEMLADLGQALFWLFDVPTLERVSAEALTFADALGRTDLAAIAMGWLARCRQAGGNVLDALDQDRKTIERFGTAARVSHSIGSLALYWAGRGNQAVALSAKATGMADEVRDATFTMYSLSHSALALAAVGRYAEAERVFGEMRAFGRKYGVVPLLARGISMSGGYHFSIEDYDIAERIQLEARELALGVNFSPTVVSPNIDLLLIAARRHDPGGVEQLFVETVEASKKNPGWHGWLWELRLTQVRAELAFAREEWQAAAAAADEAIDECRRRTRPKYEALGQVTRAQALSRLHRQADAVAAAREAVRLARAIEDPALVLRALDTLLQIEGDDATALEAKTTCAQIRAALSDESIRGRFDQSDIASRIAKL